MKKFLLLSFLFCLSFSGFGGGELVREGVEELCEDPMAVPVIAGDLSLCEGEELQLTSSVVAGAISYHWSGPNGLEESGTVLSIDIISPSFSGVYDLMVVRAGGTICDTAYASVNVIVHPTSFVINEHQMCPGDVYEYNGGYYTAEGQYYDVFQNIYGCDSTVMTDLSFFHIDTDAEITNVNGTFVANATGVTYQWIDCDNGGEPIPGATRFAFTPPTNGVYAVITTSTFCENVWSQSGCENYVGINEITSTDIQIFPSPFQDHLTIKSHETIEEIRITDLSGRLIYQSFPNTTTHQCNLSDVGEGLFIVRVFMRGGEATRLVTSH